ncbi:hypothetical protein HDU91_005722 [Kappamyces sp. JEL0680]|nr:hypothetical protein HDU91_005722 [Kappamyces sp. JEL0680]
MLAVDRAQFCGDSNRGYLDQAARPGSKVLDVGSGSGYLTTCLAHMVGPTGCVVGIDHIEELNAIALHNIRKGNADLLDTNRLKIHTADGRLGWAADGPYDAIHVGAWSKDIPQPLMDQLAPGGCMFIPTGVPQQICKVEKKPDGTVTKTPLMDVLYVPLTDKEEQLQIHEF